MNFKPDYSQLTIKLAQSLICYHRKQLKRANITTRNKDISSISITELKEFIRQKMKLVNEIHDFIITHEISDYFALYQEV